MSFSFLEWMNCGEVLCYNFWENSLDSFPSLSAALTFLDFFPHPGISCLVPNASFQTLWSTFPKWPFLCANAVLFINFQEYFVLLTFFSHQFTSQPSHLSWFCYACQVISIYLHFLCDSELCGLLSISIDSQQFPMFPISEQNTYYRSSLPNLMQKLRTSSRYKKKSSDSQAV